MGEGERTFPATMKNLFLRPDGKGQNKKKERKGCAEKKERKKEEPNNTNDMKEFEEINTVRTDREIAASIMWRCLYRAKSFVLRKWRLVNYISFNRMRERNIL